MTDANYGKIQIYTGDGKGKTTAAVGLAVRAAGQGKKVVIIFFDKGGADYGERRVLDLLPEKIIYHAFGRKRTAIPTGKFALGVTAEDKREALKGLQLMEQIFKETPVDLLILDEINKVIDLQMLKLEHFLKILDNKPTLMELVLTGRAAHPKLLERADLITEMVPVKHYFNKGVMARKGIEY